MNPSLSPKQIGHRIMDLRKAKGLSQEDLAKSIGISRPSLTQIELGNRSIDIFELQRLSMALEFSLNDFLSPDLPAVDEIHSKKRMQEDKNDIRISVPDLQVDKFKNVLLYILESCAGKPNIGETALRYKKLPFGPVPHEMTGILNQMIGEGRMKRIKTEYHGFAQTRYLPLEKANLTQLSAAEKTVIDHVIQQMSDWSASMISDYSHKDMPWLATQEGDYISYNLAFYRELPYSVRLYEEEKE
ncbi:MAG: helix-turn-helix domain-containing protein [Saprospirales bacterium]|nr:helix-turn-helix domain-containing protein [Saprospirales bacterium]